MRIPPELNENQLRIVAKLEAATHRAFAEAADLAAFQVAALARVLAFNFEALILERPLPEYVKNPDEAFLQSTWAKVVEAEDQAGAASTAEIMGALDYYAEIASGIGALDFPFPNPEDPGDAIG